MDADSGRSQERYENMSAKTNMDPSIYARRKRVNFIGLVLSMSAMVIGLVFLLWILAILMFKGFSALSMDLLTQVSPAPGTPGGGLSNAIVGSLMMVGLSVLVAEADRELNNLITDFNGFDRKFIPSSINIL